MEHCGWELTPVQEARQGYICLHCGLPFFFFFASCRFQELSPPSAVPRVDVLVDAVSPHLGPLLGLAYIDLFPSTSLELISGPTFP